MSIIEWNDEDLAIGIAKIDEQHKQLIALSNSLVAMPPDSTKEQLEQCFYAIRFYLKSHFSDEERIMQKMSFPGIESHTRDHNSCLDKLGELEAVFKAEGTSPALQMRLAKFFSTWFLNHIKTEDAKYSRYLLECD